MSGSLRLSGWKVPERAVFAGLAHRFTNAHVRVMDVIFNVVSDKLALASDALDYVMRVVRGLQSYHNIFQTCTDAIKLKLSTETASSA